MIVYYSDDDPYDWYDRKQECIRSKHNTEWDIYLRDSNTDDIVSFHVKATAYEMQSLLYACYDGMNRLYQYSSATTLKDRIREYATNCPDKYLVWSDLEWYFRLDEDDDMFEDCSQSDEFVDIILENFDELYEERTR